MSILINNTTVQYSKYLGDDDYGYVLLEDGKYSVYETVGNGYKTHFYKEFDNLQDAIDCVENELI